MKFPKSKTTSFPRAAHTRRGAFQRVLRTRDDTMLNWGRVSSVHRVKLGDMVNVPCSSRAPDCSFLPQHACGRSEGWNEGRSVEYERAPVGIHRHIMVHPNRECRTRRAHTK